MTKWTAEYKRKYQREWYQLKKRGGKLKTCKICKRLFSVSVSASRRKFCESPDCKVEANRRRVMENYDHKRKSRESKNAVLAPPRHDNRIGISTHQIQAEMSPDKLIHVINNILNNKSRVIGLRK